MPDIIITLPQKIEWKDYQRELDTVSDFSHVMRFKVGRLPKQNIIGNRCYLVWRGKIRGWMTITGMKTGSFTCSTTGTKWKGNFIERSGPFVRIIDEPYKPFQGWRYFDPLK